MVVAPISLREDYWTTFSLGEEDIEFIYNYLLELETPQTSAELTAALVAERIQREKVLIERQHTADGLLYFPKGTYSVGQSLVFPAINWQRGMVDAVRPGHNPEIGEFQIIRVKFENGEAREFACGLEDHVLNQPPKIVEDQATLNPQSVMKSHGEMLVGAMEDCLNHDPNFVRIAGRWFPRALLVDVNAGHLNLAEAVLDMMGGGPLPTSELMKQLELSSNVNPKLVEFSLDLALQEDARFDEVGPSGEVLWFLNRLEPAEVLQPPLYLRYAELDCDRNLLTPPMLTLERDLDDELSSFDGKAPNLNEVQIRLIYPHWRAGTLPLSARMRHLFPTAYEAPRIRFTLVDSESGQKFPAWVVRPNRYVYGLHEWYTSHNLMPGSLITVRRGALPGEVVVKAESRRPIKDYIRTVLVGSDGGTVFAMLKQSIASQMDERMAIAVPDIDALDAAWLRMQKDRVPFERIVVNTVRELAKLNPQSHVHASELYAAVNIVRRCPPGPILALLASRPWFVHVGDLHFRFDDSEKG